MKSLIDIGKKYPTSKNKFGFVELYDVFFKQYQNKNINILEIGVDNGDSLRLWRDIGRLALSEGEIEIKEIWFYVYYYRTHIAIRGKVSKKVIKKFISNLN